MSKETAKQRRERLDHAVAVEYQMAAAELIEARKKVIARGLSIQESAAYGLHIYRTGKRGNIIPVVETKGTIG